MPIPGPARQVEGWEWGWAEVDWWGIWVWELDAKSTQAQDTNQSCTHILNPFTAPNLPHPTSYSQTQS